MRLFISYSLAIVTSTLLSTSASAGLINVAYIEIENAIGEQFQVSEVVATQTGTGNDLALASAGATASATGYLQTVNGSCKGTSFLVDGEGNADCVIDGFGPQGYFDSPFIYHGNSVLDVLTVVLAEPSELDSITVFGRTDTFDRGFVRDFYDITLFDAQGVQLHQILNASAHNDLQSTGAIRLPDTSVPAPATLPLFGMGLAVFGWAKRKRRDFST